MPYFVPFVCALCVLCLCVLCPCVLCPCAVRPCVLCPCVLCCAVQLKLSSNVNDYFSALTGVANGECVAAVDKTLRYQSVGSVAHRTQHTGHSAQCTAHSAHNTAL